MDLRTLRNKLRKRLAKRKRQKALYKKTHKRGYALAAARNGRAARKLRKLIANWLHEHRGTVAAVNIRSIKPGRPAWGGAAYIMGQFVTPFMLKRGLPKGSGKRTPAHNAAIGGSPTSDHLTTKLTTFARDFPTFSGEDDARALANEIGWTSWQPNSFATFRVEIDGHLWIFQILWGSAIGHGDHVHVGISYDGVA